MFLNLFDASEAYLAFDKAPFQGCLRQDLVFLYTFLLSLPRLLSGDNTKACHRANGKRLRDGRRQEKGMIVREYGQKQRANTDFS